MTRHAARDELPEVAGSYSHVADIRGPAKLYRRSSSQLSVNLPRDYELVGRLFASAVTDAQHGARLGEALRESARTAGRGLGRQSRELMASRASRAERRSLLCADPIQQPQIRQPADQQGGMMRKFSIRPTLTLKGRRFQGLRGWSGKPMHPPLTDFPIVAYVLGAGFDVVSAVGGESHTWAHELWHAATFTFVVGGVLSVLTALTGLWDAMKSSEAGTQARRTINTHATIMVTATVIALVDIIWRLNCYNTAVVTPTGLVVVSVIVALLVSLGATFGGTLVYDYGFNVEAAGDSPVWHQSEKDVLPGQHGDSPPSA